MFLPYSVFPPILKAWQCEDIFNNAALYQVLHSHVGLQYAMLNREQQTYMYLSPHWLAVSPWESHDNNGSKHPTSRARFEIMIPFFEGFHNVCVPYIAGLLESILTLNFKNISQRSCLNKRTTVPALENVTGLSLSS
jgi:hypothetical protein